MKFEFSAGGIVYRIEKEKLEFALILDSYSRWTFPKGRIEKKEKSEAAAGREVAEELGLKISDLTLVAPLGKIDYWYKKDVLIHKFVYFYLFQVPSGVFLKHQKEEILDARWFNFQEASAKLDYKKDDEPILKKAWTILKQKPIT